MNRRSFLKKAGIAAGLFILPSATTYSRIWKPVDAEETVKLTYNIEFCLKSTDQVGNVETMVQQLGEWYEVEPTLLSGQKNVVSGEIQLNEEEFEHVRQRLLEGAQQPQVHEVDPPVNRPTMISYSEKSDGKWRRTSSII